MELFKILIDKNHIDKFMLNIETKEKMAFKNAIKNNDIDFMPLWINLRERTFMRNIFHLIKSESVNNTFIPKK